MIGPTSSRAPFNAAFIRDIPSRICRSTFSTTTIASSTTNPTESTIASNVSKFSVNPKICVKNTAPMSEIGIATTGTITERKDPRNKKITIMTMRRVSSKVLTTSWIASLMYAVAFDHVHRVRVRQHPDAHEHRLLTGEPHLGVVILRAEHHIRDVAEPNERSFVLTHD